jgi:hypothetical protein
MLRRTLRTEAAGGPERGKCCSTEARQVDARADRSGGTETLRSTQRYVDGHAGCLTIRNEQRRKIDVGPACDMAALEVALSSDPANTSEPEIANVKTSALNYSTSAAEISTRVKQVGQGFMLKITSAADRWIGT